MYGGTRADDGLRFRDFTRYRLAGKNSFSFAYDFAETDKSRVRPSGLQAITEEKKTRINEK